MRISLSARKTVKTDVREVSDLLKEKPFYAPENVLKTKKIIPKTAPKEVTRGKTSTIQLSEQGRRHMTDLMESDIRDAVSDKEAHVRSGYTPEMRKAQTKLPAIVNKKIASARDFEPEWHMVKHLPGYLRSQIRAVGRSVFKPFTSVPIEDIQVLAFIHGADINSKPELNMVASWLKKHGIRATDAELKFSEVMPGYEAKVVIYNALGYDFMLVKDFAGEYIYCWATNKGLLK